MQQFFINSTFIGYIVCKFFSQFWLAFSFYLMVSKNKSFKFLLSSFNPLFILWVRSSKEIRCLSQCYEYILLIILYFRLFILAYEPFQVNFCVLCEVNSAVYFALYWYTINTAQFVEKPFLSPLCIAFIPLLKIKCSYMCRSFSILSILLHCSICPSLY